MPVIRVTKEMLESIKPFEPGWHKGTVLSLERRKSKDGKSINLYISFKADDGRIFQGDPAGCILNNTIERLFWDIYFKFIEAVWNRKILEGDEIVEDELIGKPIQFRTEDSVYNNRIQSKIVEFLPYEADTSVPF